MSGDGKGNVSMSALQTCAENTENAQGRTIREIAECIHAEVGVTVDLGPELPTPMKKNGSSAITVAALRNIFSYLEVSDYTIYSIR